MDTIFNYNGKIGLLNQIGFNGYNRAFKYGDGIIETIRVHNSKPLFLENHYSRIKKSAKLLKFELGTLKLAKLYKEIEEISKRASISNGFVRLQLYRAGEGAYTPTVNSVNFLMSIHNLSDKLFEINTLGFVADIYSDFKKPINNFSFLKSCNAQLYVMAGLFTKQNNLDSCFIVNESNELIEALYSNLFIVKGKTIFTPTLKSGCIEGTMRPRVIKISEDLLFTVKKKSLFETDLLDADEVFLTNAVRGIEWVGSYKKKRYFNFVSKKISRELIKLV